MDKKTLIIFTGGPGTGKSKTAEKFMDFLADDQIVKISYDEIKEKNWDRFGFDDQGEKERLDHWSLEEFYLTLGKRMWEEKTIVVEYPFCQKHKSGYLQNTDIVQSQFVCIQIIGRNMREVYCVAAILPDIRGIFCRPIIKRLSMKKFFQRWNSRRMKNLSPESLRKIITLRWESPFCWM